MKQLILLGLFVVTLEAKVTPQQKLTKKINKTLTNWLTPQQLNFTLQTACTQLYAGFNIANATAAAANLTSMYATGGLTSLTSLLSNPAYAPVMSMIQPNQFTTGLNITTTLQNTFGTNYMAPLLCMYGVFNKTIMPLYTKINKQVQKLIKAGKAKKAVCNKAFTMAAADLTPKLVKKIFTPIKSTCITDTNQWATVQSCLAQVMIVPSGV